MSARNSSPLVLRDGVITDYPLDSYTANFHFHVLVGTAPNQHAVPVRVVFDNIDAFFKMSPRQENSTQIPSVAVEKPKPSARRDHTSPRRHP